MDKRCLRKWMTGLLCAALIVTNTLSAGVQVSAAGIEAEQTYVDESQNLVNIIDGADNASSNNGVENGGSQVDDLDGENDEETTPEEPKSDPEQEESKNEGEEGDSSENEIEDSEEEQAILDEMIDEESQETDEEIEQLDAVGADLGENVSADASGKCGDNLTWTLAGGTLTISGTGRMDNYITSPAPWEEYCDAMYNLVIGEGVTSIGNFAFSGCSEFTGDLTIPNNVTSIGRFAFYGCSGFTGDLIIPDSVTEIGDYAFEGCSGFTGNLIISDSLTYIDGVVFRGCSGFTGDLVIPDSVTSIGSYAFEGCSGFTGSLLISNNVSRIGNNAFEGCSGFTGDLVIPDSVTSIERYAFYGCSGFAGGSLTIPSKVTEIGERAFYQCGFTGNLIIPDSLTEIGERTFYQCSFTGDLVIPDSVTSIGTGAFYYCGFTGNLIIPDSLTSIGSIAFYYCGFTGNLIIPDSLTSIGGEAFSHCGGLKNIYFKGKAPKIYGSAFEYITAKAYYPSNIEGWESVANQNYGGTLTWIPYPPGTEPWLADVPSDATFYLGNGRNCYVYEEDKAILLWGGFKAIQEGNVIEETDDIVWESSDSLIAQINHVSYRPDTGNIYGDSNADTLAYFDLYLDCYKPGIVTITGTSADGRTVSTTILIEPELVVKEEINISDDTEIIICSFSVEEPNAEFLKEIISGITIKCKYSESPFVDERLEVTEDGLRASIVWEIFPEFDGNFIYEVKSLAGQKKEIRVNVEINEFNRGDTWHFENYKVRGIPLTESDYARLIEGMSITQKAFMDSLLSDNYNGQCFGMVTISLLAYKNVLSLNEIDENISRLYDAINTTQVKSLIGYYHLSQLTDAVQQNMKYFKKLSTKEQLQAINNSKLPAILEFGHDGWGDHGVLIYKIEHDGPFMAEDSIFDTKVSFYDPNDVWVSGSGSALYFNEGTDQWTIPRYAEKGVSSAKGGYLRGLCADTNIWNNWSWSTSVLLPQWMRGWIATSDITLYTENQTYTISGGSFSGDEEITVFYDDVAPLDDQELPVLNIRLEKQTNCTIVPNEETLLDWAILYDDYFLSATADSYDSVSFDKEGAIAATGLDGAYSLNLTTNKSPLPWYTLEFTGSDAAQFSVELVEDGIQISGDNLNDITVYGTNDVETKELAFSTDEDKVILSEEDGEFIIVKSSETDESGKEGDSGTNNGTGNTGGSDTNGGTGNTGGFNANGGTGDTGSSDTDNGSAEGTDTGSSNGGGNNYNIGDAGTGNDASTNTNINTENSNGNGTDQNASGFGADNSASSSTDGNAEEPRTGVNDYTYIYATIAMIAGFIYIIILLLERHGMTEDEKQAYISRLNRWSNRGGKFRRLLATVAISLLLAYYHIIGRLNMIVKKRINDTVDK